MATGSRKWAGEATLSWSEATRDGTGVPPPVFYIFANLPGRARMSMRREVPSHRAQPIPTTNGEGGEEFETIEGGFERP